MQTSDFEETMALSEFDRESHAIRENRWWYSFCPACWQVALITAYARECIAFIGANPTAAKIIYGPAWANPNGGWTAHKRYQVFYDWLWQKAGQRDVSCEIFLEYAHLAMTFSWVIEKLKEDGVIGPSAKVEWKNEDVFIWSMVWMEQAVRSAYEKMCADEK